MLPLHLTLTSFYQNKDMPALPPVVSLIQAVKEESLFKDDDVKGRDMSFLLYNCLLSLFLLLVFTSCQKCSRVSELLETRNPMRKTVKKAIT